MKYLYCLLMLVYFGCGDESAPKDTVVVIQNPLVSPSPSPEPEESGEESRPFKHHCTKEVCHNADSRHNNRH